MTFKKSMISIAAASVIAAGITGCGSSNSGSTGTTTGTSTTSAVKAVNSYIVDANVTAWDFNTTSATYDLVDVAFTYDTATKTYTPASAKEFDYLRVQPKASSTYVDYSPYGDYNATSSDVNTSATAASKLEYTLYMPKGGTIITPASSLVYEILAATGDLNASVSAIDGNFTTVANALGITKAEMGTDPINGTNAYQTINRLARGALTGTAAQKALFVASLKTSGATAAASWSAAIDNLTTAANAAGLSTLKDTLVKVKALGSADKALTVDLAKAVTSGGELEYMAGKGIANYYLTQDGAVYVNSDSDADSALDNLAGHKVIVNKDIMASFYMEKATDTNVTGQTFDIAMKAKYIGDSMNDANTTTMQVTIKGITIENTSNDVITLDVNQSTLVDIAGVSDEGNTYTISDVNLTTLMGGDTEAANSVQSTSNLNTIKMGAILRAATAKLDVDNNLSADTANFTYGYGAALDGATSAAGIIGNIDGIWDMDLAIISSKSISKKATAGDDKFPMGSNLGGYSLIDNVVDQRGAFDGSNNKPVIDTADTKSHIFALSAGTSTVEEIIGGVYTTAGSAIDTDINNETFQLGTDKILMDVNSSVQEANVTIAVTNSADIAEKGVTYKATLPTAGYNTTSGFITLTSDTNVTAETDANVLQNLSFTINATSTTATSIVGSHPEQNITITAYSDEFGKLGTVESNLTIALNRAPSASWTGDVTVMKANGTEDQNVSADITTSIVMTQDAASAKVASFGATPTAVTTPAANVLLKGLTSTDIDGDAIASYIITDCTVLATTSITDSDDDAGVAKCVITPDTTIKISTFLNDETTVGLANAITLVAQADNNLSITILDMGNDADIAPDDNIDFNITVSPIDVHGVTGTGYTKTFSFIAK